jgi:hypothetical protein
MENHIFKTRKVREPAFSAIYVWIDPYDEGFECYMKKHTMRSLGWACSNEDLKAQMQLNHGHIQLVSHQLKMAFRAQFGGNISYLRQIFDEEIAETMVGLIELFIQDAVETCATANRPSSAGNIHLN